MRTFLRIGTPAAVFFGIVLGSDYVYASTCCAAGDGYLASTIGAWFGEHWKSVLGIFVTLATPVGISMFSAPDTLDAVTSNDGEEITYTPGASQKVAMYIKTAAKNTTKRGEPLVAVDTTISLETTVNNPFSTGTASIEQDDLARLLEYLTIESPLLGKVLDETTGTGPILDLVISFLGQGFNRAGDVPIASIVVPGSGTTSTAVVKYFTFPWAQRFLLDPSATSPWMGLLHNTKLGIKLAASTALGDVSTGATTSGATSRVRATTSYVAHAFWYQPLLPFYRLDNPSSGSNGLTFQNFGSSGPDSCDPIDWVHTIGQLSNLKGLPGNTLISNITKIMAPSFGLDSVYSPDHLVKARLQAQVSGRTSDLNFTEGGNHAKGAANTGMNLAKLLFLLLRQPSLDMRLENMLKFQKDVELPIQETFTSAPSGAHGFLLGSCRRINEGHAARFRSLSGNKLPLYGGAARPYNKA
jgi:hypothetical protein